MHINSRFVSLCISNADIFKGRRLKLQHSAPKTKINVLSRQLANTAALNPETSVTLPAVLSVG